MTATEARPPIVAEELLVSFLRPQDRESVSGDLLEEYREAKLPQLGAARADRWYWRQVAGFGWGLAGWFGVAAGVAFVARDVYDLTAPTNDYWLRSAVSTWSAITIFFTTAVYAAWRTAHWHVGVMAALAACVIHSIIGIAVATVLAVSGAPESPGGYWDVWGVAVVSFAVTVVVGTIGAALGKVLASRRHIAT